MAPTRKRALVPTDRITKRVVDAAAPRQKTYLIRDSNLKGFVVVITPYGGKSYALDYRAGRGRRARKRQFTIGKHRSPWTPETARNKAFELLGDIAKGIDPAERRNADQDALTLSELCDLYFAEGAAHKKRLTVKADRGRVTHHLKPLLGRMRVDAISRADVERLLVDVAKGRTAVQTAKRRSGGVTRGGTGVAAQCVTLLGTLLAFAVRRGYRNDNPAHGIKKPPVRKLERFLSDTELARLATALDAESNDGNPYAAATIKLLLFTGCRKGEILGLLWQHVDFENACLRLPDSKTGAKIVYLNAPALAVLQKLPRRLDNPHVIIGARKGLPLVGIDKAWSRVQRRADLRGVRLHDLRHSFASVGARGGLNLPVIGALLGHKHTSTTARYAHLSADPIRAANEVIGARIEAAMTARTNEAADTNDADDRKRA